MPGKDDVLKLMNEAEVVYLATISEKGPRIRALVNLRRADLYPGAAKITHADFTVYLATSAASDKVADIRANRAVSVYYCDPKTFHGVMLAGTAEVLDDPALKATLWCEGWKIYWPAGVDDPDYVVVRINPDEIKGWWGSVPFAIETA